MIWKNYYIVVTQQRLYMSGFRVHSVGLCWLVTDSFGNWNKCHRYRKTQTETLPFTTWTLNKP